MHGAYVGTLGLMECKKYLLYMSLESADSNDCDVLREKIESWENS